MNGGGDLKEIAKNMSDTDRQNLQELVKNVTTGKVPDKNKLQQFFKQVMDNQEIGKFIKGEVQKIYNKFSKGYKTHEDKTLRVYVDRLRSMRFFICYSAVLKKLDKGDVKEMRAYLVEMLASIDNVKTKKPLSNFLFFK